MKIKVLLIVAALASGLCSEVFADADSTLKGQRK